MDCRGVLLIGLTIASAIGVSCTAPDPGELTFSERRPTGLTEGSSGSAPTDAGGGGTTDAAPAPTEGGAPSDPVFGTSAFTPGTAAQTANGASAQHAGNVEGKDCAQGACHGAGGAGPTWGFGGTVKTAATGGAAVAGAEVRVTGSNGVEYGKTYTDTNGNFWYESATPILAGSRVGIRNATKSALMAGAPAANCNGTTCHGTGAAQGAIFLAP